VQSRGSLPHQLKKSIVAPPLVLAAAMLHLAPASAATCIDIASLALPNTTITLTQAYLAGATVSGNTKAPVDLCRVAGTIKPGPQSNVRFEVWIPTDEFWNGKYQQVGNGGFAGSIPLGAIANAASRGYAAAGTDDGTSGPPAGAPAFIGNMDVLLDYGYRAVKATGDISKTIIAELTGEAPRLSYFVGCSDGGREALQEAQRFPGDFDGIIVGSPVNDQVGEFGASYLYDMQATLTGPQTNGVPDAYIPASKLAALTNAVLDKCAGKDGGLATDAFRTIRANASSIRSTSNASTARIPTPAWRRRRSRLRKNSTRVRMTAGRSCSPASSQAVRRGPGAGPVGSPALRPRRQAPNTRWVPVSAAR
jgi:feruloyl esterase